MRDMRMPELKVEQLDLALVVPYSNNSKKHTNQQIDAVATSIEEFGFRSPILVWENEDRQFEIVAGHARAAAAQKLGMETVPCIICNDLDDAQRRALTIVDNQTSLMTGFDHDMLDYELDTLGDIWDFTTLGFEPEMLTGASEIVGVSDGEPQEEKQFKNGEVDLDSFSDERFDHECPKCHFKFND